MAIYTVHEPPRLSGDAVRDADRFVFVRDGFYGWAFLLAPLWMLWHRLWLVLVGYLLLVSALEAVLLRLGASGATQAIAAFLLAVLVATEGGSLRRFGLWRRRYRQVGVVVGDDVEAAERRFFAAWNEAPAAAPTRPQAAAPDPRRSGAPRHDVIGLFPTPGAPR